MIFKTEGEARDFLTLIDKAASKAAKQPSKIKAMIVPTTHGHWTITGNRPTHSKPKPWETCSICGEEFPEFSNNAEPVNGGRCCAYCDQYVVTPARIKLAEEGRV